MAEQQEPKDEAGCSTEAGPSRVRWSMVDVIPNGTKAEDQFASDVVFASVYLVSAAGFRQEGVVIKRPLKNERMRQLIHSDTLFYNEHLMYSEVLPYLEAGDVVDDLYPMPVHTNATQGENYKRDVVVLEDLRRAGYKLTSDKVFLDFDHCALAMRNLGRFHALSYAKKQENAEEFLEKAGKLKDATFGDDEDECGKKFLANAIERGVRPLLESGEHVEELTDFLNKTQDPRSFMKDLKTPEEPIAVICHGDFNRNNMVFRYDDAGKPVAMKFFDVANARYASPVIDVAFFLTMNTTSELRNAHWDDLLRIYHEGLSLTAPKSVVPSLEEVRAEVRKKAVYGYNICSFFIPMMMDGTSKSEVEDFASLPAEVIQEMAKTKGGEKCTNILMDIVRDLLKFQCL